MEKHTYTITYSVGISPYDERRYTLRGVPRDKLANRIAGMVRKGKIPRTITLETA